MKIFKSMIMLVLVLTLFLTACSTPPPPVSEAQLGQSIKEALAAEKELEKLIDKKEELERKVNEKKADLEDLMRYGSSL